MSQTDCDTIRDGLLGDTVGFLQRNMILIATSSEPRPSNTIFRNFDFNARVMPGGTRIFELPVGDGVNIINGHIQVYFLPWGVDSGYHIVLERDGGPDIMLTAQMGGCSVGYIKAGDGATRVSHHNLQSSRAHMDRDQRQTLSFAGSNAVHPKSYFYNKERIIEHDNGESSIENKTGYALVYGVRKEDGWHMYKQRIRHTLTRNQFRAEDRSEVWNVTSVNEF